MVVRLTKQWHAEGGNVRRCATAVSLVAEEPATRTHRNSTRSARSFAPAGACRCVGTGFPGLPSWALVLCPSGTHQDTTGDRLARIPGSQRSSLRSRSCFGGVGSLRLSVHPVAAHGYELAHSTVISPCPLCSRWPARFPAVGAVRTGSTASGWSLRGGT